MYLFPASTGDPVTAAATSAGGGLAVGSLYGSAAVRVRPVTTAAYGKTHAIVYRGDFKLRQHELLYWIDAESPVAPGLACLGLACFRSGAVWLTPVERRRKLELRAGQVLRPFPAEPIYWPRTTAGVYAVVVPAKLLVEYPDQEVPRA
jgi:hypothetical protein